MIYNARGDAFIVQDKATRQPFAEEVGIGMKVSLHAQQRGLMVRPLGHMIVLSPPLILTAGQIDNIGSILRDSIIAASNEV